MGNITRLTRNGHRDVNASSFGLMDDLTYWYQGNRLQAVDDAIAASAVTGFKDGAEATTEYFYDGNGNMTRDDNKGITNITYNHLNLPTQVSFVSGNIQYTYDAAGSKLRKTVTESGNTTTTDYLGGYVYENGQLQFFNTSEGYVYKDGGGQFRYVYQYRDHLGNIRLSYSDDNNNGSIAQAEIREENNYYPFGLEHKGYNNQINGTENNYFTYQGVELSESFGYNLLEFELRHYDPALGRFIATDPYEQFHSPYVAMGNNPVVAFDPTGGKCFDANGKEVACPDDEMYDEYRDSDENHITMLDEVEVSSSQPNNQEGLFIFTNHRFPAIAELSGIDHFLAEVAVNIQGYRVEQGPFGNYNVDAQGNVIFGPYNGGLGTVGLIGGFYNPKNLLKVATLLDKGGLTKIGRALQKHGSRAGSKFPKVTGNQASINAQGEQILSNILNNPASTTTTRHHARFGDILEVMAPNGQGARFSADGETFIGLIEKIK
ncbi:RHS repeat-associated core domain-containing protein [Ascidiimonas aurantiaca]|uniref:RHS repeat domain-containing protein n=1 Tax=Ascidiimonas aurantiaca TaxID=1685432 RepID=UPI0030ECD93C